MLPMQQQITGINHPQVAAIYLKHDYRSGQSNAHDILVIETNFDPQGRSIAQTLSYLEFLNDLEDIRAQAERKIGRFDRIDIRRAH